MMRKLKEEEEEKVEMTIKKKLIKGQRNYWFQRNCCKFEHNPGFFRLLR
jgi:hypothetical protein